MSDRCLHRQVLILLVVAIVLFSCCDNQCKDRYVGCKFRAVTQSVNNNENHYSWYLTDYLDSELNFFISFMQSQSTDFDCCADRTNIHELMIDQMVISCSTPILVGVDTLQPGDNLFPYMKYTKHGNEYVLEFDRSQHEFFEFQQVENVFNLVIPLTDGKSIINSVQVAII